MEERIDSQVKIYHRPYTVAYPKDLFDKLCMEFAQYSKGECKPGSNRTLFRCVYCGRADFSNKMMLNAHRFEKGCPEVKDDDGVLVCLYPYPDWEPGQGKIVEQFAKLGKSRGDTAGSGGEKDDDFVPTAKKTKTSVPQGYRGVTGEGLPITSALILGPALRFVPKKKKGKTNVAESVSVDSLEGEEPKSKKGQELEEESVPEGGAEVHEREGPKTRTSKKRSLRKAATTDAVTDLETTPLVKHRQAGGSGRGLLKVKQTSKDDSPDPLGDTISLPTQSEDNPVPPRPIKKREKKRIKSAVDTVDIEECAAPPKSLPPISGYVSQRPSSTKQDVPHPAPHHEGTALPAYLLPPTSPADSLFSFGDDVQSSPGPLSSPPAQQSSPPAQHFISPTPMSSPPAQ